MTFASPPRSVPMPECGWCGALLPTPSARCGACGMRNLHPQQTRASRREPHKPPSLKGTSMIRSILAATAAVAFLLPASAGATTVPPAPPTVTLTVDSATCTAHAEVDWPFTPKPFGINQLNVDNHAAQDNRRQLNQEGDQIVFRSGKFVYDVTLAKGAVHLVEVLARSWESRDVLVSRSVDCTTPSPPVIQQVEVPGPERVVPGPERVVTKTVTKIVTRAGRCRAAKSRRTGRRVLVCPKRPAKRRLPAVVRRAERKAKVHVPAFTG